jgi:hypothetical protein
MESKKMWIPNKKTRVDASWPAHARKDTLFGLLFAPAQPGQILSAPVLYYSLLLSDPVCVYRPNSSLCLYILVYACQAVCRTFLFREFFVITTDCCTTHIVQYRGRILGRNWDKSLKSFPPCYSQSPLLTDFSPDFLFVYIFSFWFYIIFWWILTCTGNALLYTDGLSVYSHNWSSYRTWCLTIALPYIL